MLFCTSGNLRSNQTFLHRGVSIDCNKALLKVIIPVNVTIEMPIFMDEREMGRSEDL